MVNFYLQSSNVIRLSNASLLMTSCVLCYVVLRCILLYSIVVLLKHNFFLWFNCCTLSLIFLNLMNMPVFWLNWINIFSKISCLLLLRSSHCKWYLIVCINVSFLYHIFLHLRCFLWQNRKQFVILFNDSTYSELQFIILAYVFGIDCCFLMYIWQLGFKNHNIR